MGIECIRGMTIRIEGWGFTLRVFFVHPAGNQSNLHKLTSETECKEWVDWSEQQEVYKTVKIVLIK